MIVVGLEDLNGLTSTVTYLLKVDGNQCFPPPIRLFAGFYHMSLVVVDRSPLVIVDFLWLA
jgi:hypothetical protein